MALEKAFHRNRGNRNSMSFQSVGGGIFEPCRKCDYLFNHTSGKVSGGTEGETLCVKKMIN